MVTATFPLIPDAMPSRNSITVHDDIPGNMTRNPLRSYELGASDLPPKDPRTPTKEDDAQLTPHRVPNNNRHLKTLQQCNPLPTLVTAPDASITIDVLACRTNGTNQADPSSSMSIIRRTASAPKLSESKSLENEAKDLLNRPANAGAARRCAEYAPTLKELQSVSFSDYIRGEVLGVPLPGFEFLYVYDNQNAGRGKDVVVVPPGLDVPPDVVRRVSANICSSCSPAASAAVPPTDRINTPPLEHEGAASDYVGTSPSPASLTQHVPHQVPSTNAREQPASTVPLATRKKIETPSRMRTRSQSKAIENLKKGQSISESTAGTNGCIANGSFKPLITKEITRNMPQPKKYQMCWYKLRDGIAKVSLPQGFWAKLDTTARGRHWAKGSKLGDTVIPSPIKQCISGIGGVYEYTLIEQPPVTVSELRTQADEYRQRQLGQEFDTDQSDAVLDELARKFWRRLGPTMEPATYGADMEGTLFKDAHAYGWNVDRLESCLQLLRADAKGGDRDDEVFHVPGVTSAYLYFGMWASVFAAHTEDMNLLSINYLHAGSPKYWYAISPEDSKRFETLARSHFPGQASECNEFLRHKRCLLSPAILKKAGIKFTTCIQRPGDAIITFPGSYHFGFNTGFNIAESTNFAVPEWIPIGEKANFCMCVPHSVRIQMKRLKSLLEDYEKEMCYRASVGMPKLTYSAWAKQEAKRMKKELRAASVETMEDSLDSLELPTAYNTGIAVEITKEAIMPKKSKKKSFKRKEFNEWRYAKRARPGSFVPNTDVIILVDCHNPSGSEIMENGKDYEFFIGTIVKVLDGHVKVHLTGLGKKEDLWYEQNSPHLFLDGGVTEAPSSSDEETENKPPKITRGKRRR
mmetsp:Transcript_21363/g.43964  ORF Transcript_21363/g.43964 Transcript_21363/m.43964 type:complete len:863 (+) Transcript_21363:212-2800(+)